MQLDNEHVGLATDLEIVDRCLDVSNQFLVDAGCGNMHFAKALAERGASVLAIDPDPVQAELNRAVPTIANVGFAECGAEKMPLDSGSVDGVLFPYSLHHVPKSLYRAVFDEVLRVLKPDGFLYVLEPVADGDLNSVMQLFHDERQVRADAQLALEQMLAPQFLEVQVINYSTPIQYESWEQYASDYAGKSYNQNYTESDIRSGAVEQRFMEVGEPNNFHFEAPKRVTWLRQPVVSA